MRSQSRLATNDAVQKNSTPRRNAFSRLLGSFFRSERGRKSRGNLMLESLEARQMLAGDVDLLATDGSQVNEPPPADELVVVGEGQGEPAPDLVAFARLLDQNGVEFYGADWCPACTAQKELFQDGGDDLPFTDVTDPDRSFGATAQALGVTTIPTWEFPDGTRVEGIQSLEELSRLSGIEIPQSEQPTFETIGNQQVRVGSPLHIGVDAYDPDGGVQTITVTADNPALLEAVVLTGNRSIRIDMETYGDMVFELFEQRAPRASGRVIQLAESGFYDGIIFHRVVDDFVIQGGDPTGTGSGGSPLGDFADDFHPDLQHNGPGVLSFAKSGDDTNDSQFFITETDTRFLDFNHSIFGHLVEGEDVREAISEHAVGTNDRPTTPIAIESIDVFDDTENAVIMLKALTNTPGGSTNVTVTTTDTDGNTHSETFRVDIVEDVVTSFPGGANTADAQPFLEDISFSGPFPSNSPAEFTLNSIDIEGDPVSYFGSIPSGSAGNATLSVNESTGEVVVTPTTGFAGTVNVNVGVRAATGAGSNQDTELLTLEFEAESATAPTNLTLLAGSDSGSSNSDGITNSGEMVFLVEGVTPGAQVEIINVDTGDNIGIGAATEDSLAISTNNIAGLGDGTYSLAARQAVGGVTSELSPSIVVTFDTQGPALVSDSAVTTANVGRQYQSDLISSEEGSGLIYALTSAPDGATIDATTGVVTWTPTAAQVGSNDFELQLTDAAGNTTTDSFTVSVAGEPLMDLTIELVDASGNQVTSVDVGDRFFIRVTASDARDILQAGGVFAAHTDVLFDNALVRPAPGATIEHGPDFANFLPQGTIQNGIINEAGGTVEGTAPTNQISSLLFTLEMEAIATGTANIRLDPPEDNELLLFGVNRQIEAESVSFGNAILAIGQNFAAVDDQFTVDEDSGSTTLDVLGNDSASGSNTVLSVVSVTQPAIGGSVTLTDGVVAFTPAEDFNGTAEFTYRVSNNDGVQEDASVTVTVNPVNDPPVAVSDSFQVDQDSSDNSLDVLSNDSIAPDAGETLIVTQVTSASNGTVSVSNDGGSLVYTPNAGFSGVDSVTYTISDGGLTATSQATITVAPADPPPVAVDDAFTVSEDAAEADFDVLANDQRDSSNQEFVLDSVGTPSDGGAARISADGTQFFYQPAADFFGTETVTYTIRDTGGGLGFGTVTFTVDGVNDPPPVTNPTINLNRGAGETTVLSISDLPVNVDGDSETLVFQNLSTPTAGGTATINASGDIVYTPATDFVGDDTFAFDVSDGSGIVSTGTLTVTVSDFTERDIVVSDLSAFNVQGVELSGNDVFGEDVTRTLSVNGDGEARFEGLLPGAYQVTIPAIPFLQGGESAQTLSVVSAPEDGDTTVTPTLGRLRPEFVSIRDFLGSTPRENVVVAVPLGGSSVLATSSPSTTRIENPSATLDSSGLTVTLAGTDDTGAAVEATLNTTGNADVQLRGTSGDLLLYKINVEESAVLFSPVDPSDSDDDSTAGTDGGAQGEQIASVQSSGGSAPASAATTTETLIVQSEPQAEQIAAGVSRIDTFVPNTDAATETSDFIVSAEEGTQRVLEPAAKSVVEPPHSEVVDSAMSQVSPRLTLLSSAGDEVAESNDSGTEEERETAIDAALTEEI